MMNKGTSLKKRKPQKKQKKSNAKNEGGLIFTKSDQRFTIPESLDESHIIIEGQEYRTDKELAELYSTKLNKFRTEARKEEKQFLELPFIQNEREWVRKILGPKLENKDSSILTKNLFRYLAAFLNWRLSIAENEYESSPAQFETSLVKYTDKYYNESIDKILPRINIIDDFELKKNFIDVEIKRVENDLLEWASKATDLTIDLDKKAHFLCGQKYLSFLKQKKQEVVDAAANDQRAKNNSKADNHENNYTHIQICIAYEFMRIHIDDSNAASILERHSTTTSTDKLLQKRIDNVSTLTELKGNKKGDTMHLKDLNRAKRLISGMKNEWRKNTAEEDISRVITAFETNIKNRTY